MRTALRRLRDEGDTESPRTIAWAKGGAVAALLRRPSGGLGERCPPLGGRLRDARSRVPAVSRIVLRPLNLR